MRRDRLTFEMREETRTALEVWARQDGNRSVGSLLRQLVEKAVQERRASTGAEASQ
jgi:hypothetical protein